MPTNEVQLSTGNSSGAVLRTFSATENSSVVHYQPAWMVFGNNTTTPTPVDSTARLPTSAAQNGTWILGANSGVDIGDVTVNNSSATPVPTSIQIDTRPLEGSTGGHTSTAFGLVTRQVGNSSVVVTNTVTVQGNTTVTGTVTVQGNTTAVIQGNTTAIIQGNSTSILSTLGMGGTADNPVWTEDGNYPDSTRVTLTLTSTTPSTLISSGGSTRINVVDLDVTGTDAQTLFSLFSNSTASTSLLFSEIISSGGGGFGRTFKIPVRTIAGQALVAQINPASTGVYINAGGYRST